jgi:tRNA pseudouridine13 synthase
MKLKQQPEDFQVEELTTAVAGTGGEFAFYRLEKTGWTTHDALAAIRRRWQIDSRRLGYGGLKDRHAATSQYITIYRGPKRNLAHERIKVTYLGQRAEPFSASDISANRFTITLRAMSPAARARAEQALMEVQGTGVPNYFDDQRFGSVGDPPEFVAREMVFGRYEPALQLALAAPYEFDRADARREKATLLEHWGNWATCKPLLPRGHARSLVDYLVTHPTDFKGAVARLRPDLQGLYLAAYQSYLWNRILAAVIARTFEPSSVASVDLKLGKVPVPTAVLEDRRAFWESLVIPLPSSRVKPASDAVWLPYAEEVLSGEGLSLAELRIKGMQKPFFSKGDRAACVRPANLALKADRDERNTGRDKLVLKFDLPRGSYATMLVKRITAVV